MLLLAFFLLPMVLVTGRELTINNYIVKINDSILKNVEPIGESSAELDLSGLDLTNIDELAFQNSPNLTNLNLANNLLTIFPSERLTSLVNLKKISVANNRITEMPSGFVGLDHLEVVDLSNNPLKLLYGLGGYGLGRCDFIVTGSPIMDISQTHFSSHHRVPLPALTIEILTDSWILCFGNNPFTHVEDVETLAVQLANDVDMCPRFTGHPRKHHRFHLPANSVFEVCIHDGTLTTLSILTNENIIAKHCDEGLVRPDHAYKIELAYLNITNFVDNWYRPNNGELSTLDLRHNAITHLSSNVLNDLPESVETALLSGNKIERLESGIIENKFVIILDLSFNGLRHIADNAFIETILSRLVLSGNNLTDTKFVKSLPLSLMELNLSNNTIAEVSDHLFSHLNKLRWLNLDGNKITELRNRSLQGLSSLEQLVLSNNGLQNIESGAFQDLGELGSLDLAGNNIAELKIGLFSGMRKLFSLRLMDNHLTKITSDTFQGIPLTLLILDLSNNRIESLGESSFVKVPEHCLFLNGNNISTIEKGYFDLPHLQVLDLHDNKIRELKEETFDMPELRELNLGKNLIREVKKGTFRKLGKMTNLIISDNPLETISNGSLVGLSTLKNSHVHVSNVPLRIIESPFFYD